MNVYTLGSQREEDELCNKQVEAARKAAEVRGRKSFVEAGKKGIIARSLQY